MRASIDGVVPLCTGAHVGEAGPDRPDRTLPIHAPEVLAELAALRSSYDPQDVFVSGARLRAIAAERSTGPRGGSALSLVS